MRSELHHDSKPSNSPISGIVQVITEVASALMLLGDLIASKTHTVKKSDHSEPLDAAPAFQPV
jgi:hypothetical protein